MSALRRVFGAFRILRQRSAAVGQPGLAVWADTGERAAVELQAAVRDGAHKSEVNALSIEVDIVAMLKDGAVDLAEITQLRKLAGRAHRVADGCHAIGEAVK